jgi:pimeloyl-ACP methyl ester carboxylesterase
LHPKDRDNEALIERVRAMGTRLGGDVFRRQSMLERPGDLDRLSEIRCPTLVVAASQDQLRSLEEARELQAGIPGATLERHRGHRPHDPDRGAGSGWPR